MADLPTDVASIRERTVRQNPEPLGLWEDGINQLVRGMDSLAGIEYKEPGHDRERVMFGVLAQAISDQLAGHWLATSGYNVGALSLVRGCAERWLAFYYVWNHPQQVSRFL